MAGQYRQKKLTWIPILQIDEHANEGAAYVGYMDDLAVFDRSLTDVEVDGIYRLQKGIGELYP